MMVMLLVFSSLYSSIHVLFYFHNNDYRIATNGGLQKDCASASELNAIKKTFTTDGLNYIYDSIHNDEENCLSCGSNVKNSIFQRLYYSISMKLLSKDKALLTNEKIFDKKLCMLSGRSISSATTNKGGVSVAYHSYKKSIEIATLLSKQLKMFPLPPPVNNFFLLDEKYTSQRSSNIFMIENFSPALAKRSNVIIQTTLNNLCTGIYNNDGSTNHICPQKILEIGCGAAGNLNKFCTDHTCTHAVS